jgi:hypothetical protein
VPGTTAKQISTDAYQALRDALSVIFWWKKSLGRYMRTALRGSPEVLSGINFEVMPKREAVDEVVDRLMANEGLYQAVTLRLMLEVANRSDFSELAKHEEADEKLAIAREKVAALKKLVQPYEKLYEQQQRLEQEQVELRDRLASQRRFSEELDRLRVDFLAMHSRGNQAPQQRGKQFERFLNRVFGLFDLEPRLAYDLAREQLDGAFSLDTDDYIVEAKWRVQPLNREESDAFDAKVKRKGRNALGLIISISGLTADARDEYSSRSTFITIDGLDLMAILEGHVRLDDAIIRKKRHVNETGACYFSVSQF